MTTWIDESYVGFSEIFTPSRLTLRAINNLYFEDRCCYEHEEQLWPLAVDVLKQWTNLVSEQESTSRPTEHFLIALDQLELLLADKCGSVLCEELADLEYAVHDYTKSEDSREDAESRRYVVQDLMKKLEARIDQFRTTIAFRKCGATPREIVL